VGSVLVGNIRHIISDIFKELINSKLLDNESKFYTYSLNRVHNTCEHFLPIIEILKIKNAEFIKHSIILFASTFFLDNAIDGKITKSQQVRSFSIYNKLQNKYYDWLKDNYDSKTVNNYQKELDKYYQYLIDEKKWDYPNIYFQKYGSLELLYLKAGICFFPLNLIESKDKKIEELIMKYYTFLLLGDDLVDFKYDIKNKIITYVIIQYWKENNKMPNLNTVFDNKISKAVVAKLLSLKNECKTIMKNNNILSLTITKNLNQHIKL